MRLPRALAPWAPLLDVFPREVGLALGPLARRVGLALGPLASQPGLEGGEPDGFDGLDRRGSYERLMLSELAVADEYPDEFLRRAVMGEHLFYRVSLRSPARSRLSVALFDAGPNQLGAPRLAHLAALVAFARRAEAAGARFCWSALDEPDAPLLAGVTPANVNRLLEFRSTVEADGACLESWRERLACYADLDDVWLVGGARTAWLDRARAFSHLVVTDPCDPAARCLDLAVTAEGKATRSVRLDLPGDATCARLLRDPFAEDAPVQGSLPRAVKGLVPGSRPRFDPGGLKLFARHPEGGVIVYPVPNSPRAGVGRPKVHKPYPGDVIAAGRAFRRTVFVSARGRLFSVDGAGARVPIPPGYYMPIGSATVTTPGAELGVVHAVSASSPEIGQLLVLDQGGQLLRFAPHVNHDTKVDGLTIRGTAMRVATDVLGVWTHFSNFVFVGRESPGDPIRLVSIGHAMAREDVSSDGEPEEVVFGFAGGIARVEFGLVALRYGNRRWRILTKAGWFEHIASADSRVVGVVASQGEPSVGVLLAVTGDGRSLVEEAPGSKKTILTSTSPILHVAASPALRTIAYSTERGDLVIWSLGHDREICRFVPEGV